MISKGAPPAGSAAFPDDEGDDATRVFVGGGEMGALMRALDWADTPIGPLQAWPQSLRTAVSILLSSRFPMLIWWGPDLVMLYNDDYRPMLGRTKHPAAMGQRGRACWPEIWDVIGPMLEGVLEQGEATWSDDQLLLLDRNGYVEECYFTFSYSPIRDESGGVGGVFTAVTETTARVLGERRLRTLRDLAARTGEVRGVAEVCSGALEALETDPLDLPFALLYLVDADETHARLAGTAGLLPAAELDTEPIALDDEPGGGAPWPLGSVARSGEAVLVSGIGARFGSHAPVRSTASDQLAMAGPAATALPREALLLPVAKAGQARPAGFLVAGISPRRALDDDYRGFLDLVAGQLATALANVRAYEEERRRAEALAALDRAKTTFFSNVSHEFRTPLTLLLGPLEDALSGAAEPAAVRAGLETARRNALRLLKLVNTLLDFSRIESARLEAVYEPVDLAAYTAELAGLFRAAVERAGLRLLVDCPPLPEPVYVDREMWEKIVLNLLSNAFKHTFAGEIAVALRSAERCAVLSVRDTGTGIPAGALPHLFERFYRVRGARARTHEGSGIGLALVQELVRLHGGTIAVESVEGAGTTVTVTLPPGAAHLPAERIDGVRAQPSTALGAAPYVEEALRWLPEVTPAGTVVAGAPRPPVILEGAAGAKEPAARQEPGRARVLLADDNADMRGYLARLLRSRYDVEAVGDGAAALAAALARPPDLVLSDVMMPGLDGGALLHALRADPRTCEVPVVLLSARAGEESTVEGLEAGADDYLVKPFSARELLARIGTHAELGRLRRASRDAIAAERDRLEAEVAARVRAEAVLRRQTALLELAHDAIIVRDARGAIVSWNEGARELYGWTAAEAWGRVTHELLGTRVAASGGAGAETDAALVERGAWDGELEHTRRDGAQVVVESRQALLRAADGTSEAILEVNRDVTARKRFERAREEFLAAAAHDLKTPLTAMRGHAQLARRRLARLALPELARIVEHLAQIDVGTAQMVDLIDDLLDVTQAQAGQTLLLDRQPADLAALVRGVAAQHSGLTEQRIRVETELVQLQVRVDAARIERVVGNLLSNAIKYSPEGGDITVHITREDGPDGSAAVIAVEDHGLGIPAADLPYIFERFRRARNVVGQIAGTGIGLASVRQIVAEHGGTVDVESQEGRGAVFTVRLPLNASLAGQTATEEGERNA